MTLKIIRNPPSSLTFGNLKVGEVFTIANGHLYLKVAKGDYDSYNAIVLQDAYNKALPPGYKTDFSSSDIVFPVKATLTIEE